MAGNTDIERTLPIADVYAAALFDLARRQDQLDAVLAEFDELVRLIETDADFAAFLAADVIDRDHRAASLERIFRGRLSDLVLDTLQVLNRHGRSALVTALRRAYVLRLEHARGQVEVTARSAQDLDSAQRAAVERTAAELSGKIPVMTYVVEPALIGGLVLQIGDRRYDASVFRRLQQAYAALLARSNVGQIDWSTAG